MSQLAPMSNRGDNEARRRSDQGNTVVSVRRRRCRVAVALCFALPAGPDRGSPYIHHNSIAVTHTQPAVCCRPSIPTRLSASSRLSYSILSEPGTSVSSLALPRHPRHHQHTHTHPPSALPPNTHRLRLTDTQSPNAHRTRTCITPCTS